MANGDSSVKDSQANRVKRRIRSLDRATLQITIASTIVAVASALAAIWSSYEAHETRIEDERPYLGILSQEGTPVTQDPLTIQSYGRTAALNVTEMCVLVDYNGEVDWSRITSLRPTERFHPLDQMFPAEKRKIECYQDFKSRNYMLAYGLVRYSDAAGRQYQTPFCVGLLAPLPEKPNPGYVPTFQTTPCGDYQERGEPMFK